MLLGTCGAPKGLEQNLELGRGREVGTCAKAFRGLPHSLIIKKNKVGKTHGHRDLTCGTKIKGIGNGKKNVEQKVLFPGDLLFDYFNFHKTEGSRIQRQCSGLTLLLVPGTQSLCSLSWAPGRVRLIAFSFSSGGWLGLRLVLAIEDGLSQ